MPPVCQWKRADIKCIPLLWNRFNEKKNTAHCSRWFWLPQSPDLNIVEAVLGFLPADTEVCAQKSCRSSPRFDAEIINQMVSL